MNYTITLKRAERYLDRVNLHPDLITKGQSRIVTEAIKEALEKQATMIDANGELVCLFDIVAYDGSADAGMSTEETHIEVDIEVKENINNEEVEEVEEVEESSKSSGRKVTKK